MNMKSLTDCYVLNNGVKIPCIGFGTFLTPNDEVCEAVKTAVKVGYRHIDTAAVYGNEVGVGQAIKECGVPREELFITSKLWNSEQGYETTLAAFEKTMKDLGLEYLDLYLIHWPIPHNHKHDWQQLNAGTWKAFEELYKAGRIKAIGVSNFMPHHLEPLMKVAEIKPMVNQLEYHPAFHQDETVPYCNEHNILVESWGPLMQGKAFSNDLLKEVAAKYNKSVAQICIRWELQKGVLPLPKSVHEDRIRNNADVFDFNISDEDMAYIDTLGKIGRLSEHPDNFNVD